MAVGRDKPNTDMARASRNLEEAIVRAGLRVSIAEFVDIAAETLSRSGGGPPIDATEELDPETRRLFIEGGMTFAPLGPGEDRSVVETAATYARLVADSGTVRDAALRLGLTEGRVRQMLRARELFGIREGDAWRVPWFQFDGNRPVRGLDRIVRELPPNIHPVGAFLLLTSPNPDLEIDERPVSPLTWLRSGGDPTPIAELASDLGA